MQELQPALHSERTSTAARDRATPLRRTTAFRRLLHSSKLDFLLEAHNGLSAKIAAEAGFEGIWAGGLCMSAQFGVRDNNEASWTQVLEMLEFMADAVSIPILLDGDTGYGNFNNVRRLVRKLEQRSIAAVCIEDKLFPKCNSFINGKRQELAGIDEFCGRIKAGKDAQLDDDFSIITRVEAFIAGWGLDEALRRASAYHEAGADGVLIHSALTNPSEVLAFKREWGDRCPVLIVPTKYYSTPTEVFQDSGFSMVIWANQLLRACVPVMQETAQTLWQEQSLCAVEDRIAPVGEVFRLQGAEELQRAEQAFLPGPADRSRVVVLAASRGVEFGEATEEIPKTMLPIGKRPLLQHIVDAYNRAGFNQLTVVRGYRPQAVDVTGVDYVDNPEYEHTGEIMSLGVALESLPHEPFDLYVSYGDVLFNRYILDLLTDVQAPFTIVVDADWHASAGRERPRDYVACSEPHTRESFHSKVALVDASVDLQQEVIDGEWMGFLKVSAQAMPEFRTLVARMQRDPEARSEQFVRLLREIIASGHTIRVVYTVGHWLDVDGVEDLAAANAFA